MAPSPTFTKGELIELIPCILEEIERAEEQGREDDKTQFEEELKHFHGLFLQREDDEDDDDDDDEDASEAPRLPSSSSSSDLMDIDNDDGDDSSILLSGLASSDDLKDNGNEDEQKGKAVLKLRGHHDAKGKAKAKEGNSKPKFNCKCGCGSKNVSRQKILDHKKAKGKKLHCKQTKNNGEPCAGISGTARDFKNHHKTVHHWNEEQLKKVEYDWSEGREDGFTDPENLNWMAVDEKYVEEPEEEAEDDDDDGSNENEDDDEIGNIE